MAKKSWLVYTFISSFGLQSLLNLWWVFNPAKISALWFVAGNLIFGLLWICSLSLWIIKLVRARRRPDAKT